MSRTCAWRPVMATARKTARKCGELGRCMAMPAPGGVELHSSRARRCTQADSWDHVICAPSHIIALTSGFDAARERSVDPIVICNTSCTGARCRRKRLKISLRDEGGCYRLQCVARQEGRRRNRRILDAETRRPGQPRRPEKMYNKNAAEDRRDKG